MPPMVEKKVRGKKKKRKKKDPRILDTCVALGRACGFVDDFDDARRFLKRAKEGYEEQLGRDSEKTLDATYSLVGLTCSSDAELIEKYRDLLKRMEKVSGEENVVTLTVLNTLGGRLRDKEEYEEARKDFERCLAGQMKVLEEDHKQTLNTVNNLGNVYFKMKNYEKALDYYERALKGKERMLGKNYPGTLSTMMNISAVYVIMDDNGNAEELYQGMLEGYEAQFGKDHKDTRTCAQNFKLFLELSGNEKRLELLMEAYPWLQETASL